MASRFPLKPTLFLSLVSVLAGVSCATPTKSRWKPVTLERAWSRSTVADSYYGALQPAVITPQVQKDILISGNSIDGIQAFHAKSGNSLWKLPLKNGLEGVTFDDKNNVYFGADNGQFYHLNGLTGEVIWSFSLGSESVSSPLIQGNFIFHTTMNGSLFCIERETGRVLWVKSRPAKDSVTVRGTTSPVFFDGKVAVGYSDGYFVVYTAIDGSVAWEKALGDNKKYNDVDARPIVTDKCILVATVAETLFCMDKANGNIVWRLDEGGTSQTVCVENDTIYLSQENAILKVNLPSGKVIKRFPIDKKWGMVTGAALYKNWLVFGLSAGPLVVMDKESGEWVDTFASGRGITAIPAVSDTGEIYITSNQANVYKLRMVLNHGSQRKKSLFNLF